MHPIATDDPSETALGRRLWTSLRSVLAMISD
jgi:hypothetical protein